MSNFICFDTEDNSAELLSSGKSGFDKKVTQIAAISDDGRDFYNRGSVPDFLKWLRRQPEKYIYAHNLQYDLGNLFANKLDSLDIVMVGGRLIRATWGEKTFLDTFNIWPMSAKMLGKAFGLEKLETDSMSRDKRYVFRDVEIIQSAMQFAWQFCDMLGLPKLPPTLGGLSVKLWRAWGGENLHESKLECREALYGGRVELFKHRSESPWVAYTDLNSLYPFACAATSQGRWRTVANRLKQNTALHSSMFINRTESLQLCLIVMLTRGYYTQPDGFKAGMQFQKSASLNGGAGKY